MRPLLYALLPLVLLIAAANLAGRPDRNEKGAAIEVAECGAVELVFDKSKSAYARISFQRTYSKPPLVLVSECYSAGSWIIVKAEGISKKECTICAVNYNNTALTYRATVAYIAFASEQVYHPLTQVLKPTRDGSPQAQTPPAKGGKDADVAAGCEQLKKTLEAKNKEVLDVQASGPDVVRTIVVRWRPLNVGEASLVRTTALYDLHDILWAVHEAGIEYHYVRVEGLCSLTDIYGQVSETVVIRAEFERSKVGRINWEQIDVEDLPKMASSWYEHPALSK